MAQMLLAAASLILPALATPRTGMFNETESLLYLRFSQVSFCEENAIRTFDCGDMCDAVTDMGMRPLQEAKVFGPGPISGVSGFTAVVPGPKVTCVVAFRGSVNLNNWLTDANAYLKDFPTVNTTDEKSDDWCPDCQIHWGFADAYDELKSEIEKQLREQRCTQLFVAGHSLGAGVATVAGIDFRANGWMVPKLWVYGSPRVGNDAFVQKFVELALKQGADPPAWRVVHFHDPVPHTGLAKYYTHIPEEVYFPDRASALPPVVCPWDPDNLSESYTSCATWNLTVLHVTDGLVQVDHTNYMNLTFGLKDMNLKCQPMNACTMSKGYVKKEVAGGFSVLAVILAALVGRFFTIYERFLVVNNKGYSEGFGYAARNMHTQGPYCQWSTWRGILRRGCGCGSARVAPDAEQPLLQ